MAESKSKAEATIEMKDSMQSKIPLNINSLLEISPSQTVQSYQPTPKTHLEVARQMYPLTNVEAYKLMRIISVKEFKYGLESIREKNTTKFGDSAGIRIIIRLK